MPSKSSRVLLISLISAFAAATSPASARTYEVVSCDATGGVNHAWTADFGESDLSVGRQRCPAFGSADGLMVRSTTVDRAVPNGFGSAWRFDPPLGTSVVGVDWAGEYATYGPGWSAHLQSSRGQVVGCGPAASPCVRKWTPGSLPLHRDISSAAWLRIAVDCSSGSCRGGDGHTRPNAMISTWYSRVQVNDPSGPTVKVTGEPWVTSWVTPASQIHIEASDASGISQIRLLRDGNVVSLSSSPCDFTRPRPCQDRALDLALEGSGESWEGRAEYSVEAVDAAGNRTRVSKSIGIDGTAPDGSVGPAVDGGDGWRPTPVFSLSWTTGQPAGQSAVVSSQLKVCRANGDSNDCLAPQTVDAVSSRVSHATVRVPAGGEWDASVVMTDEAGNSNQGQMLPSAKLRFDDVRPPAPSIPAPIGWLTRERAQNVRLRPDSTIATVNPSGIAGWAWALGSDPESSSTFGPVGEGVSIGDLPEGISDIHFRSISRAGLASRTSTAVKVRIDETPPTAALSGSAPEWQRAPVGVSVVGRDQTALSGMSASEESRSSARLWVDGGLADVEAGDSAQVTIDMDGVHTVAADVSDAAGNRSARVQGVVKLDRTAPERVVFLPHDVGDPRVVRVEASDATSGLASVKVRMRPISGGAWTDLSMELKGSRAVGLIDDHGLSAGVWEMEATATDVAGNESTTDRNVVHDPALVTLPLRGPSSIETHMGEGAGASASPASLFTLGHGKGSAITGKLVDRDGLPIVSGLVTLESVTSTTGASWVPVSSSVTDHAGRFRFGIVPGPGRRIRISYAGSRRDLASSAEMQIRVPAMTTLRMTPGVVKVGARAVFSGELDGGWVPSGGKLVIVQAAIPQRGWQTFGVARAGGDGRWQLPYRFRSAVGRVRYSIRAVVPGEGDYPFASFTSSPISVTAVG